MTPESLDTINARSRREAGSAMFIAVLMLVMMGWLGLAAMDTATRDRQVAGWQNRTRSAFYAAEAGAAHGRMLVAQADSRTATPTLPGPALTQLGDAPMYQRFGARPMYIGDPAFPQAIRYVEDGAPADGMNLSNPKFVNTLWQINVVGQSYTPAGGTWGSRQSTARIEVVEEKLLSAGY